MVSFWEVCNRAINKGKISKPEEFDMKVFKVVSKYVEKYGIEYTPEEPIVDGDIADRVFQAGVEAYAELGTFCMDTGRVIRFTQEEIEEALKECAVTPSTLNIGYGNEKRVLFKRTPYDSRLPLCIGGVIESNPREGRDFVQLYKSIAQERIIDGFYFGPSPDSCEGYPWILDSPYDVQSARNAIGWVREALRSVGRPGMHLIDANPSPIGVAANLSAGEAEGLRKTDAVAIAAISELKVDFCQLNKVALTMEHGAMRNPYWCPIVGGYAGGPAGCAVVGVASALQAMLVYRVIGSGYVAPSALIQNPALNSDRPTLWVRNCELQALNKHTNLICCQTGGGTGAGPGTEQMLWEIAALGIVISSGGGHINHGPRKEVLAAPTQGSGLEPRWQAEVCQATAGVQRDKLNHVLNSILLKYEDKLKDGSSPKGYSFDEIYDYDVVQPKQHYREIYERVKEELRELGLDKLR